MERDAEPIGSRLVAEGLIEPEQLAWALERQRQVGGYVGYHLVEAGFLSSEALHDALARAWGVKRRDLAAHPPQPALLAELDIEAAIELGWIACEVADGGTVLVASCVRPDAELVEEVLQRFPGMLVEFLACSRSDIDAVALEVRRRRLGPPDGPTVPALVGPVHAGLAVGGGVLSLVASALVSVYLESVLLLLAAVVFLIGGLAHWSDEYAETAPALGRRRPRRRTTAPAGARYEDARLPLYTVVVRVAGGAAGLAELFDNFRDLDYPRERTDAILVVAEGDRDTLAALRATSPRGWVRVAKVPDGDFLDVIRGCDHALALARGRYVVAYDQDERPAPDQLRRAVAVFETDLVDRLEGRLDADPLVGLRVAQRTGPRWPTPFDRLTAVDEVLSVDDAWSDRPGPVRSPDVTSVHFNTGLLRRSGGFGLLYHGAGRGAARGRVPRIESLDSRSLRATNPTARQWLYTRADHFARILLDATRHTRVKRVPDDRGRDAAQLLLQTGGVAMFLAYPVALGAALALVLRRGEIDDWGDLGAARMGVGIAALVLCVAVVVGAIRLVRRRGWRSGALALALPVHWFLHALAAWMAVWALVVRRGRSLSDPEARRPARPS